jgi:hypothetical protein
MTRMSKGKRRSLATIGNSRVIPGERSETRDSVSYTLKDMNSRLRGNDDPL